MRDALAALWLVLLSLGASAGGATPLSCQDVAMGTGPGQFAHRLQNACEETLPATQQNGDVISAWLAHRFLGEIEDFADAIGTLDHRPSEAGAFLIAREVGLTQALDAWEARISVWDVAGHPSSSK